MSDYEEEIQSGISTLVPQLGTEPYIQDQGRWDMRILSVIYPPESLPSSFKSILYVLTRKDVVVNKKRFWEALADNYLALAVSIKGRGRNDQIRGEQALKGIAVPMDSPVQKPSLGDHLFNRDKVREYNEQEEDKDLGI